MADQLSFDWPTGVALGADDFFVSDANRHAYTMIQAPDNWPERKLVLIGPTSCGKSHLAGIFAEQWGGVLINAADVTPVFQTDAQTVIVDDIDQLPAASEEAVFHLHNHLRNTGGTLLITAKTAPARWDIALPDLASRMQAATVVHIENPDDALLSALLMKLFADRQIMPKPELIKFLTARIERSFDAAAQIVTRLDNAALSQRRKINTALARDLLDKPH